MAKKKYGVRSGYHVKGDAQDIGEELARLRKKHKGLKRTNVWRAARVKSSPMHGEFTWDLKKAAEKCWDGEAGYLMRAISIVTYRVETRRDVAPRAFVALPDDSARDDGPRTYHEREGIRRSSKLRRQALRDAILYLKQGREKYWELADELGHIWQAIDDIDIDEVLEAL